MNSSQSVRAQTLLLALFMLPGATALTQEAQVQKSAGHTNQQIGEYKVPENADEFTREFLRVLSEKGRESAVTLSAGTEHIDSLVALLRHTNPKVQSAAQAALLSLGAPAVPRFVVLSKKEDDLGYLVYEILHLMGPAAVPALCSLSLQNESYYPMYILASMGRSALPAIAEMAKHSDPRARRRAALGLSNCDKDYQNTGLDYVPEAWPYLVECLNDPDPGVASIAARGLGRQWVSEAAPALEMLLAKEDLDPGLRIIFRETQFLVDRDSEAVQRARKARLGAEDWHSVTCTPGLDVKGLKYDLLDKELPSDRNGFVHKEFSLDVEGTKFFLGRLHEPIKDSTNTPSSNAPLEGAPSEGFDRRSLKIDWLDEGKLLRVRWSTFKNARFDVPSDSTILLIKDAGHWKEGFRGSVPGYSGSLMENSGEAIVFDWNGRRKELRLEHHSRQAAEVDGADGNSYYAQSDEMKSWPCEISDGHIVIQPGTAALQVYREEFPVEQVAAHLGVSADRLRALNPALRDETICTGIIVSGDAVPPYVPDTSHRYIWSSSAP